MNDKINALISLMARLPGLGPKSSKRIVLHLIKLKETNLIKIINMMQLLYDNIRKCELCGNLDCISPCTICSDKNRDESIICIVEEMTDLWAIEKANVYRGKYHILNGVLSIIDGVTPDTLNIDSLFSRMKNNKIRELIIATNSTLEGRTTGQYIAELFRDSVEKISFLAHGIPIGSEMDYLDEGTLNIAFSERKLI
jgi:recombination protein RecR